MEQDQRELDKDVVLVEIIQGQVGIVFALIVEKEFRINEECHVIQLNAQNAAQIWRGNDGKNCFRKS